MTPEERKAKFDSDFEELKTALVMEDSTAIKVKEILWSQEEKMTQTVEADRTESGERLPRRAIREKLEELQASTREQLVALLSSEQMEKYDALQAERPRNNRGPGQRGDRSRPQ